MVKNKAQIFTLDYTETEEMFFEHSIIIGIVAPIKEFKFCWTINNHTHLQFNKCLDVDHQLYKNGRTYTFSIYKSLDNFRPHEHTIYANHYDGEYLVPELRNFDFIWLIQYVDTEQYNGDEITNFLRALHCVQFSRIIDIHKIENRNRLIL